MKRRDSRKGKAGAFHRTYTGAKLMSDSAGAISFYIDMPDWGGGPKWIRDLEKPDLDPTSPEMEKITVTCQTSATKGASTGPAENLFCVELYLDRFARFLVLRVNYSNQCFLSHSCPRRLRAQSINYCGEGFWEAATGTQANPPT